MHAFRLVAAITLLVTISLMRIAIERDNLALRRAISLQHYRVEQLLERRAHLQLQMTELTSPMTSATAEGSP